jgi:hypothetical protein
MTFVIEYDRAKGKVEYIEPFEDRVAADIQRLKLSVDAALRGLLREIVTLDAASEEALRKTHRRYFDDVEDLTKTAA